MDRIVEVYLTVEEVAQRFNVSTDSIYRWKREGDFPKAVKLSPGTVRWRLTDIVDWESTREACFATHLSVPPTFQLNA